MCSPWLPGEMWTLVFGHLALSDRLRVRSTCKFFRDLVDNGALWREWTVDLSSDEYEEHFWHMLRRWRVTSARLTSHIKLADVIKELPGLTTLIINNMYFSALPDFRSFSNLERLYLTHLRRPTPFEELSLILPQRLKHLTVCRQMTGTNALPTVLSADSPFKKLKSLVFHCKFDSHPVNVLHFLLSSLPQLQHLSLTVYASTSFVGHIPDLPLLHNCSLSSLELGKCKLKNLPMDFMKMLSPLPFLRNLAIFCQHDFEDESLKLSAWMNDLPPLTSLLVKSVDVGGFVRSIPSSVKRLILTPPCFSSEDMTTLSTQLPNLHHLHLEPCYSNYSNYYPPCPDSDMATIPQLFPRLRTLCLSHKMISEDLLLSLVQLKELEVLELLDEKPPPAALVSRLQAQSNNRVQIFTSPGKLWLQYCSCSSNTGSAGPGLFGEPSPELRLKGSF